MQYRKMKKTGDELSALGFGCMRLPEKSGKIDEERAIAQIRFAVDNGVNYLDTAFQYHMGASEPLLGKALADGYREKVKVATKLPHWIVRTREDMDKILDVQLSNLKTDHIDYYLIHNVAGSSWKKLCELGIIDFLDKAKADGRIINAGFSSHCSKDEFINIVDGYDWAFCQIQYNFLDIKNQAGTEGLKYAASKGLGVIIMEPLRGGMLAKNIPSAVQSVWNEAGIKKTPAEWALRWIWDHPEVTVVLSGMNEEEHIRENIRIAGEAYPNSLTPEELGLVKKVEDTYRKLMKVGCTGCRYCMPCPAGVNIPVCFEMYNNKYLMDGAEKRGMLSMGNPDFIYLMQAGGILEGKKPAYASQCKNCGKCVKACPQHLPIPQYLNDVSKEFEKPTLKLLTKIIKPFMALERWRTMRRAGKKT
ncbi:aldo/keto reductase [Methanocella sp. CWC-04]|uniref:Aldo/keto reductase n=1 Tax=Methanooceanicella nereidis TaxID=2052831 RepID=A0AAP2RAV9_9EURY|nr:aldo/keto reductase [Methanocella sp. CWC-04]MCD1293647.1 aldo/keto reductase [Methanocella sp. CWC-04]